MKVHIKILTHYIMVACLMLVLALIRTDSGLNICFGVSTDTGIGINFSINITINIIVNISTSIISPFLTYNQCFQLGWD